MATNEFKCPVCLDELKNPRMLLPCTHTLCEAPCLQQLLQQQQNSRIHCPVCRESTNVPSNGTQGFPRNIYVGNENILGRVTQIETEASKSKFKVGEVEVLIYQKSIVQIQGLDAIIIPTNSDLDQTAGVARVVAGAAGSTVKPECRSHVQQDGRLGVGEIFVTSSGKLPCEGIVYAVGPDWSEYSNDVKTICAQDLYTTVIKSLTTVSDRNWKSVGLCAIGCGQGGVPKQLCAEMHMKALIDSRQTSARNLKQIHFVDIDEEILTLLKTAHQEWMTNNDVLDFKNALRYV